jgi:hypothetical protein
MTPPQTHRYAITAYRALLRLFPPAFQADFGEEMAAVFAARLEQEAAGGAAALGLLLREAGGLAAGGLRARRYARRARPVLLAAAGGEALAAEPERRISRWFALAVALAVILAALLFAAGRNIWYVTLDARYDVRHVALGDFNGDGLMDAYLSVGSVGDGYWRPDYVMINQGDGRFADSGQELGEWRSFAAATGDIDNDGRVDVISADYTGLIFYRNAGGGRMEGTRYDPGDFVHRSSHLNAALADLNGDGRLDVFSTGCCGWIMDEGRGQRYDAYSEVWLNDGAGGLTNTGQPIGRVGSNAAALADLNGDGAIDAFLANGRTIREDTGASTGEQPADQWRNIARSLLEPPIFTYQTHNTVWFNDGQGNFTASGQQLGRAESLAVALGDVNGDGYPDAVVGNNGPDEVWLNDGGGNFTAGGRLDGGVTWAVFLADLDGDGDLDLVTGGETSGRVWLNDGAGNFSRGQRLVYGRYESIAAGDVTGDGIADVIAAGVDSYRLWRGQGDGRFAADPRGGYGN